MAEEDSGEDGDDSDEDDEDEDEEKDDEEEEEDDEVLVVDALQQVQPLLHTSRPGQDAGLMPHNGGPVEAMPLLLELYDDEEEGKDRGEEEGDEAGEEDAEYPLLLPLLEEAAERDELPVDDTPERAALTAVAVEVVERTDGEEEEEEKEADSEINDDGEAEEEEEADEGLEKEEEAVEKEEVEADRPLVMPAVDDDAAMAALTTSKRTTRPFE